MRICPLSQTAVPQAVWIVFLSTILIVYFLIDLVKIVVSKKLKNKLTPRLIFKTKKIIALVILGFGVLLLVQAFFPKEKELIKEKFEKINIIKEKPSE